MEIQLQNFGTYIPVDCGDDSHVQAPQFPPKLATWYYIVLHNGDGPMGDKR